MHLHKCQLAQGQSSFLAHVGHCLLIKCMHNETPCYRRVQYVKYTMEECSRNEVAMNQIEAVVP